MTKSKPTLRVALGLFAAMLFVAAQPAVALSGSGVKWLGKGKFGVAVGSSYSVRASQSSAKVAGAAKPYLKGKVFGKTFTVLDLDLKLGNYNDYNWKSTQAFHRTNLNKWKWYGAVRPFGITVGFGGKNFASKSGSLTKSWTIYSWGKYYKKSLFKTTVMAGPVPISLQAGVFGFIEFKPSISMNGITSVVLMAAPRAGLGIFAEGAVNLAVVKGGVGASLSLIEGYAGVSFNLDVFPGYATIFKVWGVEALKGKVYAFADRISIKCCFKRSWKRIWTGNLFAWAGNKTRSAVKDKDGYAFVRNSHGKFTVSYDVKRIAQSAKYDAKTRQYVYDGFYDKMPSDVRGLGSTVYEFDLFKKWKAKKFKWLGSGEKEWKSWRLYSYYKLMDSIRKKL